MATKKKALPEMSVSSGEIVQMAKELLSARAQLSELTTKETELKKQIADLASIIRANEEASKGNYIGLIRITDADQTPSQVQFKMCGGTLAPSDLPSLDGHFGSARPMLWEKDVTVGVINPDSLITEIRDRNQNPWDFLDIKVKKGLDRSLADSPNVTKEEVYAPKEGFLATCNEVKHTFTPEAKEYLRVYLETVLRPAVDVGKK
jgi:hypothetical protein